MTTIGVSDNKTELCITIENRKQMYKEKREEKIEYQKKYNKMLLSVRINIENFIHSIKFFAF